MLDYIIVLSKGKRKTYWFSLTYGLPLHVNYKLCKVFMNNVEYVLYQMSIIIITIKNGLAGLIVKINMMCRHQYMPLNANVVCSVESIVNQVINLWLLIYVAAS